MDQFHVSRFDYRRMIRQFWMLNLGERRIANERERDNELIR